MKGAILFHKPVLGALSGILLVSASLAQTPQPLPPGPPPNPERPALTPYPSDEDFSFLEDPANRTDFWDPLKFIPLGSDPADFLSLGFEYRSEYEWFHNSLWGAGPQTRGGYWLQRILADNSINAFGIGTETGYTFNTWLKPRVGLIADAISGGNNSHPGTLNTFNPLFPRGSYFAYHMALFGPYNLIHVHPALILNPAQNLVVQFDWGWFWRENTRDGLYAPGGALLRSGLTTRARYIGNQGEVIVLWALDAHTTLSFNVAGFLTGAFLQQTMPGKDIGFMNLGITYRF